MARCKLEKIEILRDGAREIMNSQKCQQLLLDIAQKIASTAGAHKYTADVRPGINRAHARVTTTTKEALEENQKSNTLLKAVRANKTKKRKKRKKRKRKRKGKKGGKK